jgi:antitoxin CcdA
MDAHMSRASSVRKVPTNVSLPAELVERARKHGLNLSALLERAIEDELRAAEREAWLAENRDAIDGYNEGVARRGLFSDDWRKF